MGNYTIFFGYQIVFRTDIFQKLSLGVPERWPFVEVQLYLVSSNFLTVSTPANTTSIAWPLTSSREISSFISKYDNTGTTSWRELNTVLQIYNIVTNQYFTPVKIFVNINKEHIITLHGPCYDPENQKTLFLQRRKLASWKLLTTVNLGHNIMI